MDSFDKGWFVLQTYSGYENKVKKIYNVQTYKYKLKKYSAKIPRKTVQVEKNGKNQRS